jgi:seryl-tRNA synthetase
VTCLLLLPFCPFCFQLTDAFPPTLRGLYRVHQFSKVEMFALCTPEQSDALHEELISVEEDMYKSLGLHFK